MNKIKGEVILLITALIWGFAFVAQSSGMEHIGPFTFNVVRFFLGLTSLFIVLLIKKRKSGKPLFSKTSLIGGSICGIFIFIATSFQQYGIQFTSVGKTGFITSLYMLIVPLFSLFLKKKIPLNTWISLIIGVIGLYFLCINQNFKIAKGDIFIFICAIGFAFQIMFVDYFSPKVDSIEISCVQFGVATLLSIVPMVACEKVVLSNILDAKWSLLYAGILSCAIAYTTQIYGQKHVNPSIASLLMSLESVFAVLGGMLILDETLSSRELIGCILIFIAVLLSQLKLQNIKKS